ncbi:UNVERIFIED_CONTAM: hypothetical protein K2H54_054930 [Gekko kuhli]
MNPQEQCLVAFLMAQNLISVGLAEHHVTWWVYPHPTVLWDVYARVIWEDEQWLENFKMTRITWEDEQWLENFKMTRITFLWIVDRVSPHLQHESTTMRDPIPVEKRVAIAIAWLANTTCYRVVGALFGVV